MEGEVKVATVPLSDKIAAVDAMAEYLRWARNVPDSSEHRSLMAFRAIAADLRAQQSANISLAEVEIQKRIDAACRDNTHPRLVALANEVIARWPVMRRALNKFGQTAEEER